MFNLLKYCYTTYNTQHAADSEMYINSRFSSVCRVQLNQVAGYVYIHVELSVSGQRS